jgi:aromatic ring-cleaving dioxygenase
MPEATGYHAYVYFDADTNQHAWRICTACGANSA